MRPVPIRPRPSRLASPLRVGAALLGTLPATLGAQDDGELRHALTVHALGLPFGVYAGEYQRVTGRRWSVGGAVVYYGERFNDAWEEGFGSDARQVIADLKLRAWSDDSPLHGFAMVLHLGTYSDRDMRWTGTGPDSRAEPAWRTAPTVALSFDVARTPGGLAGPLFIGGFGFRTLIDGGRITRQDLMLTVNGSIGLAF